MGICSKTFKILFYIIISPLISFPPTKKKISNKKKKKKKERERETVIWYEIEIFPVPSCILATISLVARASALDCILFCLLELGSGQSPILLSPFLLPHVAFLSLPKPSSQYATIILSFFSPLDYLNT